MGHELKTRQKHLFWPSMWSRIIFEKSHYFCTRWTLLTHFGTYLPLAACHSRLGTGFASAGPPLQNLPFRAKINLFLPKTALELAKHGQMKGNSGYSTHAARLPRAEGPSRAL